MTAQTSIIVEKLSNGLTLFVVPRPSVRVVTVDMWVGAGSADEIPAINGVSHFLEHMLFKGTEHYGVGQIDRIIEGVGGVINAGTSHDFTHYYVTVAAEEFLTALHIISEVIQYSALDSGELDRERQVILEEYHRKQDDPEGLLWERVHEMMFQKGPYKAPVLGVPETLQAIDHSKMLDYYHRHYAPTNMVLLVVGNVIPSAAVAEAEKAFAGFDRSYRPLLGKSDFDTVFASSVEDVLEKEVNETYHVMAFPAPGAADINEWYALDVLQYVLGGGRASILYQEIKEKRQLATSISAGYPTSQYPTMFYVETTCEEAKRPAMEKAVLDQLNRATQERPNAETLERAKRLLTNSHAFSLETTNGQSSTIGYYYTITGSTEFEANYASGIASVTANQVQQQAQKWLRREKMNRVWVRPKKQ